MRKRARIDANQPALVALAKAYGASWVSMAPLGEGVPDGLLGHQGTTHVVEFKMPKGSLTPDQRTFIREWNGSPVHVLRTEADVARLLTQERR
jgi:hypothetical protein